MWPILAVSVVVWIIGFDKLFYIRGLVRARNRFLNSVKIEGRQKVKTGNNDYDRLLNTLGTTRRKGYCFAYSFREFLHAVIPKLENGFSTMNVWIGAAPLLGLLGTVSGMIHTFKVIMEFGIGNPHMMAEGISIALLTTQAGLTVAFPAMLFHNYLLNKKNMLINNIVRDGEELSARFDRKRT